MSAATQENTKEPYSLIILILGGLTAFGPLSIDMYLPAFSAVARDLKVSVDSVQLSLASYFIGLALGQVFYGPITDRLGRKKPLYFGMGLYATTSAFCAFAGSIESLIALRFLQSLGACSGVVITKVIVRDLYDEQKTAQIFSTLMLIMGVAPIAAPFIGGYVTELWGWRPLFGILTIASSLCLFALWKYLPETHKRFSAVPKPLSKSLEPTSENSPIKTYIDILRNPVFLGYALSGGIAQAGMFTYITGSSFVFINLYGIEPERFGWVFGTNALGLISATQINYFLLKRYSYKKILNFAFALVAGFSLCLAIFSFFNMGFWLFSGTLFFFLSSLGITFPNSTAGALATQPHHPGSASALLGTIQFSLAALASIILSTLHDGTSRPMAFSIAFCGLLALVFHQTLTQHPARNLNKVVTE